MEDDRLIQASKIKQKQVERFWHERFIRGAINSISGPKKTAKSLFTVKVAADESQNGTVIYSNLEDAKAVQRDRLFVAGAKMDNVYLPSHGYSLPSELEVLEADVERLKPKLIVMDTAAKHIEVGLVKADQRAARALTPLAQLCEKHNAGLIFVDHTLKHIPKTADPMYAISSGLVGTSRMCALFGWSPQDEAQRAFVPITDQYSAPAPGMLLEFDTKELTLRGKSYEVVMLRLVDRNFQCPDPLNLVRLSGHGREPSGAKKAEAAEWLTKQLQFGPLFVEELKDNAEDDGLSWMTVRRAKEAIGCELGRKGHRKGSKVYWKLPDGHPGLAPNAPSTL